MGQSEAAVTLQEVEALRRRTRTRLDQSWVPFLVFGALVLGAVPFATMGDEGSDGFYWLAAGPIGLAVTWLLVQRRGEGIGLIDRNLYANAAILTAMVTGALVVGWLGGETAFSEVGTAYPIAAGLVAAGLINRSGLIAASGLAIAAWVTTVLVSDLNDPAAWTYAGEGAILVVAGLVALARVKARERETL